MPSLDHADSLRPIERNQQEHDLHDLVDVAVKRRPEDVVPKVLPKIDIACTGLQSADDLLGDLDPD